MNAHPLPVQGVVLNATHARVRYDSLLRFGVTFAYVRTATGMASDRLFSAHVERCRTHVLTGAILEADPALGPELQAALLARAGRDLPLAPAVAFGPDADPAFALALVRSFEHLSRRHLIVRLEQDVELPELATPGRRLWTVENNVRAPRGAPSWSAPLLWTAHEAQRRGRCLGVVGSVDRVVYMGSEAEFLQEVG